MLRLRDHGSEFRGFTPQFGSSGYNDNYGRNVLEGVFC